MRKIVTIFTVLLLAGGAVFAQTGSNKPYITAGSKALLFTFDGLDMLRANAYRGGIGAKIFMSPQLGLRGMLSFISEKEDFPINLDEGETGEDGEVSASLLGIGGAIELHLSDKRSSPYIGAGFAFSTTSTEEKFQTIDPNPQTVVKNDLDGEEVNGRDYRGNTMLSFFGLVGAEFFITREISLAAEYQLGFASTSYKDEEVDPGEGDTVTTKAGGGSGFGINNTGLLTLAIYF